jgi:hypothetical protein
MKATLIKTLKHGSKTISGEVVRRGLGSITLSIIDTKGSRSMKTFKESNYTVKCYD